MLLLLDRIQKRATVTYGEIARMLPQQFGLIDAKIFPTHIGAVAGGVLSASWVGLFNGGCQPGA